MTHAWTSVPDSGKSRLDRYPTSCRIRHEMLLGCRGSSSALRIGFHSMWMDHGGSRPGL